MVILIRVGLHFSAINIFLRKAITQVNASPLELGRGNACYENGNASLISELDMSRLRCADWFES